MNLSIAYVSVTSAQVSAGLAFNRPGMLVYHAIRQCFKLFSSYCIQELNQETKRKIRNAKAVRHCKGNLATKIRGTLVNTVDKAFPWEANTVKNQDNITFLSRENVYFSERFFGGGRGIMSFWCATFHPLLSRGPGRHMIRANISKRAQFIASANWTYPPQRFQTCQQILPLLQA